MPNHLRMSSSCFLFSVIKSIEFLFILATFAFRIHFAQNLPPAGVPGLGVEATAMMALPADNNMRSANLIERNATLKDDGSVCVFNADCISGCCIYANSASGMCVSRAGVGQICGFVYGADTSLDTHYRICQQCDTYCCCGASCCPTDYCAAALQIKPYVCTNCNTGCCCNTSSSLAVSAYCCPITYCVSTGGLKENNIKGKMCMKCQSGCCCGDTCCVSSFCKTNNNAVAQFDASALSVARTLLAMYEMSTRQQQSQQPSQYQSHQQPQQQQTNLGWAGNTNQRENEMMNGDGGQQGSSALASAVFPVLAPAPLRVLGGGIMGTRIKAYICIQCTTGCCCEVGCCNYSYCTVKR